MTWHRGDKVYQHEWDDNKGWIEGSGRHIFTGIHWVGDSLDHEFIEPRDYPELPAHIVERANKPWRAEANLRRATMTTPQYDYWIPLYDNHDDAMVRIKLVEAVRANPGKNVMVGFSGITMGRVYPKDT